MRKRGLSGETEDFVSSVRLTVGMRKRALYSVAPHGIGGQQARDRLKRNDDIEFDTAAPSLEWTQLPATYLVHSYK